MDSIKKDTQANLASRLDYLSLIATLDTGSLDRHMTTQRAKYELIQSMAMPPPASKSPQSSPMKNDSLLKDA